MASETFMGHSLAQFGVESIYDFAFGKKEWLREEYQKVLPTLGFLKSLSGHYKNGVARKQIKTLEDTIISLTKDLQASKMATETMINRMNQKDKTITLLEKNLNSLDLEKMKKQIAEFQAFTEFLQRVGVTNDMLVKLALEKMHKEEQEPPKEEEDKNR